MKLHKEEKEEKGTMSKKKEKSNKPDDKPAENDLGIELGGEGPGVVSDSPAPVAPEVAPVAPEVESGDSAGPTIYIVRTVMSAAMNAKSRLNEGQYKTVVDRVYPVDVRAHVAKVRGKYLPQIGVKCISVYGLRVCRPSAVPAIRGIVAEADTELRAIDASLGAMVRLLPVTADKVRQGELYGQLAKAIHGQILETLHERVEKLVGKADLPGRSRAALIQACERLKELNFLEDADITARLEDYKKAFEGDLAVALGVISSDLKTVASEGAFLEL